VGRQILRRILALCLFGGLSLPGWADGAAVWKLSSPSNAVYIAGSLHLLRPGAALPSNFVAAYERAQSLVMELDMDDLDEEAMAKYTLANGLLEDQSLRDVVPPKVFARLEAEALKLGLPIVALERMEPWLAAISLTGLALQRLGFSPANGVEAQLTARARGDRKEILGLETPQQQLGLFDALSYPEQSRFLEITLGEFDDAGAQIAAIEQAWQSGDLRRLEKFMLDDYENQRALYDAIVYARNRQWLPRVIELLGRKQDYLVVVGALHLVGERGVIELLRQQGLRLERFEAPAR
jgi:uncharacterized protein YbaP (TraB family)